MTANQNTAARYEIQGRRPGNLDLVWETSSYEINERSARAQVRIFGHCLGHTSWRAVDLLTNTVLAEHVGTGSPNAEA